MRPFESVMSPTPLKTNYKGHRKREGVRKGLLPPSLPPTGVVVKAFCLFTSHPLLSAHTPQGRDE